MIPALLVLVAGAVPALAFDRARRQGQGLGRGDTAAAVRRHRDFLDVLGAATGTTVGASPTS